MGTNPILQFGPMGPDVAHLTALLRGKNKRPVSDYMNLQKETIVNLKRQEFKH